MKQQISTLVVSMFLVLSFGVVSAEYGYDLHFDGDNSHVVVPHSDDFCFQGDFTIELWVNVEDLSESSQNRDLIYCHKSHVNDEGSWGLIIMGPPNPVGVIKFIVWNEDDGNSVACETPPGTIVASGDQCDPWYHIAFVYDSVTTEWTFYVDGQFVSSGFDYLPIGLTSRDLTIGWETDESWGWHSFYGWMTEIRISSIPRYNTPFEPVCHLGSDSNTIAYWDFHEGSGSTLLDMSGNGHHGNIVDGTWVQSCPTSPCGDIFVYPGDDLQLAIDEAQNGDVLLLQPGVHVGPVVVDGKELTLRGCGIESTTFDSDFFDYGILAHNGAMLTVEGLRVINGFNTSPTTPYYYPAAITVDGATVMVVSCLFEENMNSVAAWNANSVVSIEYSTVLSATQASGVFTREATSSTTLSLLNCTLFGEREDLDHGLIKQWGGNISVENSILAMPDGQAIEYHTGGWSGACNIVFAERQVDGPLSLPPLNYLNVDPLFCDMNTGDLSLNNSSPGAPANNDCGVLMGAWPVGCSTSTQSKTWSEVKALY